MVVGCNEPGEGRDFDNGPLIVDSIDAGFVERRWD